MIMVSSGIAHGCRYPKINIVAHDLYLTKKLGMLIPHELTSNQVQIRIDISYDNLLRYRRNPKLLKRTLAIYEICVPLYRTPKIINWEIGSKKVRKGQISLNKSSGNVRGC